MANQFFDEYYFEGTYREVGRQYGEAIREKMRSVYEANYERARTKDGVPDGELREQVAAYYALCEKYFPDLVEQLRGEGESSGIGDFGAMLLNVSREIGAVHAGRLMECTSYAVGGEYTTDGACYSGQNQDMANGYEENCDMVTFAVTGKPQIMFMLPVGCIGFSGMNSETIIPIVTAYKETADILGFIEKNIDAMNDLPHKKVTNQKEPFYIMDHELKSIPLSDTDITISKFVFAINEVCKRSGMKKLRATQITSWLMTQGYLEEIVSSDGVLCKSATKHGQELGITSVKKTNSRDEEYIINLYNKSAQEFILQHAIPNLAK